MQNLSTDTGSIKPELLLHNEVMLFKINTFEANKRSIFFISNSVLGQIYAETQKK